MNKYILKEPTQPTKDRLLEIKFYLFIKSFLHKAGEHTSFKTDMLGIIANTYNINTSALLAVLNTMEHPQYKPTQQEIIIGTHLMGITVRTLTEQNLVSSGTYYNTLKTYMADGEPTLFPKLTENLREVIKIFFESTDGLFTHVTNVMKGVIE